MRDIIAQMLIIGFNGVSVDESQPISQAILEHNLGGVILFDYDCQKKQKGRNIVNPAQLKELTDTLQGYANISASKGDYTPLPLLISVDYEGGEVVRLRDEYGFPKTHSAEALLGVEPAIAKRQFDSMAKTLADHGMNLNFAPVVDLNINARNPIIAKRKRAFSDDPIEVSRLAEAFISAFHEKNLVCAIKHFPGHGSSDRDTHHGFVDITESWDPVELEPYRRLLNKPGLIDMVMTGHVFHESLDADDPATLSKKILTGLLRDKLGYEGIIISDDLQMEAITHAYGTEDAIIKAINAGCDVLVFGNQLTSDPVEPEKLIDIVHHAWQQGHIATERIASAHQRIVQLKARISGQKIHKSATESD